MLELIESSRYEGVFICIPDERLLRTLDTALSATAELRRLRSTRFGVDIAALDVAEKSGHVHFF